VAAKRRSEERAVFKVRAAESKNGGAHIKGAGRDGVKLADEVRARSNQRKNP